VPSLKGAFMAEISITIPDNKVQRILDAFADTYGWRDTLGVTKAQFAKNQLIAYIRNTTTRSETLASISETESTIKTDVDGITIT
jgi:hypothetical protein